MTMRGITLLLVSAMVGCSTAPERNPVPAEISHLAEIPGIPQARFWSDEWPAFDEELMLTWTDEDFRRREPAIFKKRHTYLAVSGGADDGAFGAGLLVGWTETGTRPEFTMVTGVSTGALIAPFAFLGSDYDPQLKAVFTHTGTKDILVERSLIDFLTNDAFADTSPLKRLLSHYVNEDMVAAIARESRLGRQLSVGTVNLDAGRSVTWNISAIAMSDHPRKVELIQDILRASAAIPIQFPPVILPVQSNGQEFDEIHVDGGVGAQVFLYPEEMDWKKVLRRYKVPEVPKVFVIRNAHLDPRHESVQRELTEIAGRSIQTLIRSQGVGDLYKIYSLCVRDGLDFNLAYIPPTFTEKPKETFDPEYMTKLFRLGEKMALSGIPWEKSPPGFSPVASQMDQIPQ